MVPSQLPTWEKMNCPKCGEPCWLLSGIKQQIKEGMPPMCSGCASTKMEGKNDASYLAHER